MRVRRSLTELQQKHEQGHGPRRGIQQLRAHKPNSFLR